MTAKHLNTKHPGPGRNSRKKKLVSALSMPKKDVEGHASEHSGPRGREEAISQQFNRIQRDYSRLIGDVLKEFNLVKGWIGTKANKLKSQLGLRI